MQAVPRHSYARLAWAALVVMHPAWRRMEGLGPGRATTAAGRELLLLLPLLLPRTAERASGGGGGAAVSLCPPFPAVAE